MSKVLVIDLSAPDGGCIVCGAYLGRPHYAVPMYEGLVLPNEWPEEGAGYDACERCYQAQGKLSEPVTPDELVERSKGGDHG